MRQVAIIFGSLALALALTACRQQASSGGQSATLFLKDGNTVDGTVTKSDTSSITVQTPNGIVSTYPMTPVASVNYGAAAAPAPAAPAQQTAAAPPQPAAAPPPAATAPAASPAPPPSGV